MIEFQVTEDLLATYPVGTDMTGDILADVATVRVVGISKGKGFQ